MSDWKVRVPGARWRYRECVLTQSVCGDVQWVLEAETYEGVWDEFGRVSMDVAGEGWGENVAQMIVDTHNKLLEPR